jgi:hypothetical protein
MHLSVDDARKNMQALGIDDAAGARSGDVTESGDLAIGYGEIGHAFAGVIDDGRAFKDKIEGVGQVSVRLQGRARSHTSEASW